MLVYFFFRGKFIVENVNVIMVGLSERRQTLLTGNVIILEAYEKLLALP